MKKNRMKQLLTTVLTVAVTAAVAITGTLAYLTWSEGAVNVATTGKVKIEQIELQRAEGVAYNATAKEGDLIPFDQYQELYPAYSEDSSAYTAMVPADECFKWGDYVTAENTWNGLWNDNKLVGAMDKFVFVKNTGNTDAYYRTVIAFECPEGMEYSQGSDKEFMMNVNGNYRFDWEQVGYTTINETRFLLMEAVYTEVLAPGETSRPSLLQVVMTGNATNEDVEKLGDTYEILVYSQACQVENMPSAEKALDVAFYDVTTEQHPWVDGFELPPDITEVTPANIGNIDFSAPDEAFVLSGSFAALSLADLGEGSTLTFDDVTAPSVALSGNATVVGENKVTGNLMVLGTDTAPAVLNLEGASIDVTGSIEVKIDGAYKAGEAALNIVDSTVKCSTIFVGGHTMNQPQVKAQFNVSNSYIDCLEAGQGSTISVWGKDGVDAVITDSEIHTYSRGWHQSEDANDNAITFQGGDYQKIRIERTNMHLYGYRSVINARAYYPDADYEVDFTIDDSFIWVVSKSGNSPIWNATEITDSVVVSTKNAYGNTTVDSTVYGNPVITGTYGITTQCGWAHDIAVADGQTVTIASGADLSIYEGAAEVNFLLTGSAKLVVEEGASFADFGVKAAEGYTLNTVTESGVTTYSVSAN